MRHFLTIVISILLTANSAFGQTYINVQSSVPEEETSWFILYVNEEPQDAFAYGEMEAEDLIPGKYELRLAFNADTIADIVHKVKLERGDSLYFEVIPMKELRQEARKAGRGFGRLFDRDKDVREKEVLKEVYKLEEKIPAE